MDKSLIAKHCHHALMHHILMLIVAIIGEWIYRNTAARHENAHHFKVFRIHEFHEIFHDDIHAIFVEVAVIAETEEI